MKVGGWIERLLFGREGVERADAASKRLEKAFEERERPDLDLERARERLRIAVAECERRARKITSDPPPVVRYILPSEPELDIPREPQESKP